MATIFTYPCHSCRISAPFDVFLTGRCVESLILLAPRRLQWRTTVWAWVPVGGCCRETGCPSGDTLVCGPRDRHQNSLPCRRNLASPERGDLPRSHPPFGPLESSSRRAPSRVGPPGGDLGAAADGSIASVDFSEPPHPLRTAIPRPRARHRIRSSNGVRIGTGFVRRSSAASQVRPGERSSSSRSCADCRERP